MEFMPKKQGENQVQGACDFSRVGHAAASFVSGPARGVFQTHADRDYHHRGAVLGVLWIHDIFALATGRMNQDIHGVPLQLRGEGEWRI